MSYPASESDEVPDVQQGSAGAGSAANPCDRFGRVVFVGRAAAVAELVSFATGVRRNKFHIVSRHLPKRDVGIDLDRPFSRPSA
jgi:hypothetical protein